MERNESDRSDDVSTLDRRRLLRGVGAISTLSVAGVGSVGAAARGGSPPGDPRASYECPESVATYSFESENCRFVHSDGDDLIEISYDHRDPDRNKDGEVAEPVAVAFEPADGWRVTAVCAFGGRDNHLEEIEVGPGETGTYESELTNPGGQRAAIGTLTFCIEEDDTAGTTRFRLLHDTHFHGLMGDSEDAWNIANYFGLMERLSEESPDGNGFVVGNGDDLHMSIESSVFDGKHITEMLNASPLSYNALGNHEFDNGQASLERNIGLSEFTWLSANAVDTTIDDVVGAEQGAERYALEEVDGVTVGFTGLAPEDTAAVSSPDDETEFREYAAASEAVIEDMRADGADIVVLLSHISSYNAEELAAEVDGYDVMVGDHASEVYEEPAEINDTILSFVGDEFDYVGQLDFEIENGEIVDYTFEKHDLVELVEAGEVDPHEEIEELLVEFEAELDEELDETIGETEVELDVRTEIVRGEESNFGNWLTDVMRAEFDADVAIQNGGGIRSDELYPEGEITRRIVQEILPFPNHTTLLEVTGETLAEAIEIGVSTVEEGHGRFPQVSGMSFTYDPDAAPEQRVERIEIGGEELDPDETYELATNDFLAEGGDGYEMLAGDADVVYPPDEGTLLSALVIEAIEAQAVIAPTVEGRIRTVDETESANSSVGPRFSRSSTLPIGRRNAHYRDPPTSRQ